jgi:hypothetical protein
MCSIVDSNYTIIRRERERGERELVGHGAAMGLRCVGIGHVGVPAGDVGVVNVFGKGRSSSCTN